MRYSQFAVNNFKNAIAHRTLLVIWLITKPISMFVAIIVWTTIFNYTGAEVLGEFTLQQMINYNIFIILIGAIIWAGVDQFIGEDILRGKLINRMVRPVSQPVVHLYLMIGWHVFDFLIQVLPALIFAIIFFGFTITSIINTIFSIISVLLAFLVNFWFSYTWGLMYFKAKHYHTLHWLKDFSIEFLSGSFIPLTFFPQILKGVFKYLPFQYIRFVPARIFIGGYEIYELPWLLLIQVIWIVIFYFISTIGFKYSLKNFEGVGT